MLAKFEMEEHLPLHIPYRPWCPVCVAGEGVQHQSRQATLEEKEGCGVTIRMDYCFLSSDDGAEGDPKVLVVHDDKSEALWALAVKAKGIGAPEVSAWVAQKLEEAGYRGMPVTIKTDQEESIMALKRAVAGRRNSQTAMIESKVRVSKSNSDVERAIRKWRGQFRKLKIH